MKMHLQPSIRLLLCSHHPQPCIQNSLFCLCEELLMSDLTPLELFPNSLRRRVALVKICLDTKVQNIPARFHMGTSISHGCSAHLDANTHMGFLICELFSNGVHQVPFPFLNLWVWNWLPGFWQAIWYPWSLSPQSWCKSIPDCLLGQGFFSARVYPLLNFLGFSRLLHSGPFWWANVDGIHAYTGRPQCWRKVYCSFFHG